MSLLSGLLDHLPPAVTSTDSTELRSRPEPHPHASAATATPEWRQARDQYLNHIMACRGCYAPTGRHCTVGAHLRASYDNTPMEAHP
ncbi:hypothetical protein AB2M95_10760 [Pseudomonas chlororaphis]|uniref:hypothetical protein n=1 Tax=Pseudomonas chlororaphis TaxID=587753 RepID=UPI0034636743